MDGENRLNVWLRRMIDDRRHGVAALVLLAAAPTGGCSGTPFPCMRLAAILWSRVGRPQAMEMRTPLQ